MKTDVSVLQLANISKRSYLDRDLQTEFNVKRLFGSDYFDKSFYACLYEVNEKLVISFRGTDGLGDVKPDAQMIFGVVPNQYSSARMAYKSILASMYVKKKQVDYITGHSLGGGLAQMIGAEFKVPFVTFNAPGTKRSYRDLGIGVPGIHSEISMSQFSKSLAKSDKLPMYAKWLNVRSNGDAISRATGAHIGDVISIPSHCGHGHHTHWFWSSHFKKVKEAGAKALHQHSIDYLEPSAAMWPAFKAPLRW
ncbi:hypothetical protein GCM10009123_21670 [Kangiella japonica]|uniref:Lipase (Class 3) n=1 Tax=Kangiella japonica TaxID=647384 RepID=A0ABN0T6W5_9GAMM